MYNESLFDLRTYINDEIAIKPYYYLRNGLLHVRYTVDRCVELSDTESAKLKMDLTESAKLKMDLTESAKLKMDLTASSSDKQNILSKAWNFFTECVGKVVIQDGIAEIERRIKGNGQQNKSRDVQ